MPYDLLVISIEDVNVRFVKVKVRGCCFCGRHLPTPARRVASLTTIHLAPDECSQLIVELFVFCRAGTKLYLFLYIFPTYFFIIGNMIC